MNDIKNLSQIRSLVMGNMPRTIVHTARQPIPEGLKKIIDTILLSSEDENNIMEEDVFTASARAFRDAEDDRAAAAALGVLYSEALKADDDIGRRVIREADDFLTSGRPVYIREVMNQTGDESFGPLLENSLFIERAIKSGNMDLSLIVKHLESLFTFKGTVIKPDDRVEDTGRWFDLICKKLIIRCEAYLKDKDAGTQKPEEGSVTDREHVITIMEQTKNECDAFERVLEDIKAHRFDDEDITWAVALNEEVKK